MSENSVGEAAVLDILCQREAELVRCGNHEKLFRLKIGRELPICKPPGDGASLNQDSKCKFQQKDLDRRETEIMPHTEGLPMPCPDTKATARFPSTISS